MSSFEHQSGAAATWGGIFSLTQPSPLTLTPSTLSNLFEGLSSTLTVAQVSGGVASGTSQPFTISGSHTYGAAGVYSVTVSVSDTGGATATATGTLNVVDFIAAGGGRSLV